MSLLNLVEAQTLSIYKLMQVVVIGKDKDFIFTTFQIIVPNLKSFYNSQEFTIVFARIIFLEKKATRYHLPISNNILMLNFFNISSNWQKTCVSEANSRSSI